MVKHVKLRRSAVLNKKPNPTVDLEYGDLGLNYNVGSPTLFARAGDDTLIEWPADGVPATTAKAGVVQLADAAAIAAGTANRVVDAAQLKAATPDASETAKGVVELATAAETTTGTDATRAVHPAGLKVELDKRVAKAGDTMTGPLKLSGDPAADEEAARKKYVDDRDLIWLNSMTCQEITWIVRNAAFSVGQPGAMPFGVGPVKPAATVFFSALDRRDYYPIHRASGSFC